MSLKLAIFGALVAGVLQFGLSVAHAGAGSYDGWGERTYADCLNEKIDPDKMYTYNGIGRLDIGQGGYRLQMKPGDKISGQQLQDFNRYLSSGLTNHESFCEVREDQDQGQHHNYYR